MIDFTNFYSCKAFGCYRNDKNDILMVDIEDNR
jgi:hypothetical protein